MADWLSQNKEKLTAAVLFVVLVFGVMLAIPSFVDDTSKPQLVNPETGGKVYQKKLNTNFVIGVLIAGLIPFIVMFAMKPEEKFARIRTLPDVWENIPKSELVKWGLKDIHGMHFSEKTTIVPLSDPHCFLVRFPEENSVGHRYMVLDMAEDYLKRRLSPLISISDEPIGFVRAASFMFKRQQDVNRLLSEAEKAGLRPEEIRQMILKQQMAEQGRQDASQPTGGDAYA